MKPVHIHTSYSFHASVRALRDLALACGADDAGVISIGRPEIDDQRADILAMFPRTKWLLSYVCRMNREPIRTPARSVANAEFHHTGEWVTEVGHRIVREMENHGIGALNPPMGFPMETDRWPGKMWVISHKPVAEAAGLGRMGIHRNVIHPKFGSFILLGTILIDVELDPDPQLESHPIDFSPCVTCKLCVAACPVGAIGTDGHFDFSSCYHHNYREFLGGFADWAETLADSTSGLNYRKRVTPAETVSWWQSLGFGPNYKAAYCLAVCPAGEDVMSPFRKSRSGFVQDIVRPLQKKEETIYVVTGSDAESHVRKKFPHKKVRHVRNTLRPARIDDFLRALPLVFQRGRAGGLDLILHFQFSEPEARDVTVTIREQKLEVTAGLEGKPNVRIQARPDAWLGFLNGEKSLFWLLLTGRIRIRGSLKALQSFSRCFPK